MFKNSKCYYCCYNGQCATLHLSSSRASHAIYIYELNIIRLTISTGRRQTTWLFKILNEEFNYGLLRNNSSLMDRVGLKPATSGFQVLTTLGHSHSFHGYINCLNIEFFRRQHAQWVWSWRWEEDISMKLRRTPFGKCVLSLNVWTWCLLQLCN